MASDRPSPGGLAEFLQGSRDPADTVVVNTSILSTFLLLFALGGRAPGTSRVVPALASESGDAWVTFHAGSTWVCWSAIDPECWQRIELDPLPSLDDPVFAADEPADGILSTPLAPDPTRGLDVRFGLEAGRLWIAIDDHLWVAEPGQRQARVLDTPAGAVTLARLGVPTCGPRGRVPAAIAGRLDFVDADRCPRASLPTGCLGARPRVRRPTGVQLRMGVSLVHARAWALSPAQPDLGVPATLRSSAGIELLAVLELGFDGPAALRLARSRAELLARDRRRFVPAVPPSPLADAELDALRSVVCTEAA